MFVIRLKLLLIFIPHAFSSSIMLTSYLSYLRCRLVSEGIVTLGVTLSCCVCVRRISLGGEGNALYPVLSSYLLSPF